MHIRINIPDWQRAEIFAGLKTLASWGQGNRYCRALTLELKDELADWPPVLVSSARYALALALTVSQLAGKRVAVPGYVCPAVLTGLRAASAIIVPIDCESDSVRFNLESLRAAIANSEVDAIVAPNTYGLDQNYTELQRLGVPVIEDAAYQAGRRECRTAQMCGTRGDVGVWSFNFKSLTSVGGGVLLVKREDLAEQARSAATAKSASFMKQTARFANYAARSLGRERIPKFLPGATAPTIGLEREARWVLTTLKATMMSELQAAVALQQWRRRDEIFARQQANSDFLFQTMASSTAFAPLSQSEEGLPHLFPIVVNVEEANAQAAVYRARNLLHQFGVQTETAYPMLNGFPDELPQARSLAARLILIPCHSSLRESQMALIQAALINAAQAIAREFDILAPVSISGG